MRPRLLASAVIAALCLPVLDPAVQLFWRDTQRFFYPFKLILAQRLRHGELPLWDPWTEAGVSVLGQLTPGLWHPATLLYLLPFPVAFKLNHLIALPLAAVGAWLLARRLGAQGWAAAVAAVTYAGCGFLCAMTASNLPFALGQGTLPLAVWAILRFVDAPSARRLLLAALVLGSCGLAGEPQSMLLAGLIAGAWAICSGGLRLAGRRLVLLALCGVCGVLISAPATFPAAERLRLADRSRLAHASGFFALDARRLPGLALPWAFDDTPELAGAGGDTAYSEYFSGEPHVAFADSIAVGVPALILASFGGPGLLLGAALFLLAALGPATPVQWIAAHLIPGFGLFRYPEKLVGPASLLLALAAAAGAQRLEAADPRSLRRIRGASTVVAATLVILRIALAGGQDRVIAWLAAHGRVQAAGVAPVFFSTFVKALMVSALFAAALAVAAALRQRREVLAALVCAASAVVCGSGQLVTAPRELLETRPPLAEMLSKRAGPSAGSWRIESDTEQSLMLPGLDARLRRAAWSAQAIAPRINAVHGIESASGYGSLNDEACLRAQAAAPAAVRAVLGVRFRVGMPWEQPPARDVLRGPYGMWIQEAKTLPRAFLVARARQSAQPAAALRDAAFDPGAEAVTTDFAVDEKGEPGDARLERPSPERMRIAVRAPGRRLLVVSEHFDPGWRATVDGAEAVVRRVDGCALGVEVPPGGHRVELGFVPRGLLPGAWAAGATLLALLALSVRRCSTAAAR